VFYGVGTPNTEFGGIFTGTTATVTGLTLGTNYSFAVKAVNVAGDSVLSNIMYATPLTAPDAPTLNTAVPGSSNVTVTWTAPTNVGGTPITGYLVYYGIGTPDTPFGGMQASSARSLLVTGVTPGTTYVFAVMAYNIIGGSSLSNVLSATPYTMPNAPALVSAAAGTNYAVLTWTAPTNNGSADITQYLVFYGTVTPTTLFGATGAGILTMNVTGLNPGSTYYFGVKALNAAGLSSLSNVLNATPTSVPPAPTGLAYTASFYQVNLTWSAVPGASSYRIYRGATAGTVTWIGNSTSAAFTDTTVASSSTYYYKVAAVNVTGLGPQSNALLVSVPAPQKVPINGVIKDSNGNPLSGITVKLEDGTTTTTNATGGFLLTALPGNHTITISGPGIETQTVPVTVGNQGVNLGAVSTKPTTDWMPVLAIMVIIFILLMIVVFFLRGRGKKPSAVKPVEKSTEKLEAKPKQ